MTLRWLLLCVGVAALVSSCSKQKAEIEAPGDAAGLREDAAATDESTALPAEPGARLAALEAELAARKAELSARGLSFADEGGATPPATVTPEPGTSEVVRAPVSARTKHAPPDDAEPGKATKRRIVKEKSRKKSRKSGRSSTTKPADQTDACAPICRPAEAICEISDRICGLAEEHEDESRYAEACERAERDCERAAEACEECRG